MNDLNDNDYVMINPAGLDHSMLPDARPLIAKIVEVNREDEYIDAVWMMMVRAKATLHKNIKFVEHSIIVLLQSSASSNHTTMNFHAFE